MVDEYKKPAVKPADALGTLARRSQAFRVSTVLIFAVGLIVLAFVVGLLYNVITGKDNAPEIPSVTL